MGSKSSHKTSAHNGKHDQYVGVMALLTHLSNGSIQILNRHMERHLWQTVTLSSIFGMIQMMNPNDFNGRLDFPIQHYQVNISAFFSEMSSSSSLTLKLCTHILVLLRKNSHYFADSLTFLLLLSIQNVFCFFIKLEN